MSAIYHAVFYTPLYNTLILLFKVIPWADAGIVVVLLTIIVRFILFPLSRKAIRTQVHLQQINPELLLIKEKHKGNKEEEARQTMALYKEKGVNPFSGIFVLILQLPIIWALYQIFLHAGFPSVNTNLLYSFITPPETINPLFLGLLDITQKSVILAVLAAISSYLQIHIATASQPKPTGDGFADSLARSMQTQMKYFLPIVVFFISYKISGVIALYWFTSNVFTIIQEIVVRRKLSQAPLLSTSNL